MGSNALCDQMREKGNVVYWQLTAGGRVFAPPVRRMKLTQAEQHYKQALGHGRTPAERAPCYKNLGVLHVLWSKFEMADAVAESVGADPALLEYGKQKVILGVEYLLRALDEGERAAKPEAWLEHLHGVLGNFVQWAVEQTAALRLPRAPVLRCLCEGFDLALGATRVKCEAAVVAHLRLAESLFNWGILTLGDDESEEKNFRDCLSFVHDCMQILRKAPSLPGNSGEHMPRGLLREINDLEDRAQTQLFLCESMQARHTGDEVLRKAVEDDEGVNMELALQAVDFYYSATLLTRERDMEGEAMAMSRLGRVFSDVIKDPTRASKFHYQATKLALTVMSPRISRSTWYKYSSAKHAEFQEQVVRDEEREHEEEVAPTKKQLEEELQKLNLEEKKGGRSFLVYIYQNHPNPDPKKHPGDMLKEKKLTKEMLRKAISHYHPDVNAQHGKKWHVLCEEISKILNNKYEYFKLEKDTA